LSSSRACHGFTSCGGDKAEKWSDWYKAAIPLAEEAYADYLRNEEN